MFTASPLSCNTDYFGCTFWGKGYANMDLLWREAVMSAVLLLAQVRTAWAPSPVSGTSAQSPTSFSEPWEGDSTQETCLEPIRAVIVAVPMEEVPVAYPLGRLWKSCSYNLALLEAAQLPGSQSSSDKAAVAVKIFLSYHMDGYGYL